jgi:hypothetical protein
MTRSTDFGNYVKSLCLNLAEIQEAPDGGVTLSCDSDAIVLDLDVGTALASSSRRWSPTVMTMPSPAARAVRLSCGCIAPTKATSRPRPSATTVRASWRRPKTSGTAPDWCGGWSNRCAAARAPTPVTARFGPSDPCRTRRVCLLNPRGSNGSFGFLARDLRFTFVGFTAPAFPREA